jgi:hypothetical protein
MKKIVLWFAVALLIGGVTISATIASLQSKNFSADKNENVSDELTDVVTEYWQASLQGKSAEVKNLLTKTPLDFMFLGNECSKEKTAKMDADTSKRKDSPADIGDAVMVSEDFREDNLSTLLKMSDKIKKEDYRLLEIEEKITNGTNARVKVKYGKPDSIYYKDLLLLNKENGKWRIFMFTDDWGLSLFNKNFGQKIECN